MDLGSLGVCVGTASAVFRSPRLARALSREGVSEDVVGVWLAAALYVCDETGDSRLIIRIYILSLCGPGYRGCERLKCVGWCAMDGETQPIPGSDVRHHVVRSIQPIHPTESGIDGYWPSLACQLGKVTASGAIRQPSRRRID